MVSFDDIHKAMMMPWLAANPGSLSKCSYNWNWSPIFFEWHWHSCRLHQIVFLFFLLLSLFLLLLVIFRHQLTGYFLFLAESFWATRSFMFKSVGFAYVYVKSVSSVVRAFFDSYIPENFAVVISRFYTFLKRDFLWSCVTLLFLKGAIGKIKTLKSSPIIQSRGCPAIIQQEE